MFELKRRMAISDTGPDKKAKIFALLELIGDCEQFQIDGDYDIFSKPYGDKFFGCFLSSRQVDIYRYPNFGETISARTSPYEINPAYGLRNTFLYDENNSVVAATYSCGVFIDLNRNNMAKLPSEIVKGLPLAKKLEMDYLPRKIEKTDASPEVFPSVTVSRRMLDFYGHTNNVRYVELASDCLPENFSIKRLRCEYKTPAMAGDVIASYVYKNENKITVQLCGNDRLYGIFEFTSG